MEPIFNTRIALYQFIGNQWQSTANSCILCVYQNNKTGRQVYVWQEDDQERIINVEKPLVHIKYDNSSVNTTVTLVSASSHFYTIRGEKDVYGIVLPDEVSVTELVEAINGKLVVPAPKPVSVTENQTEEKPQQQEEAKQEEQQQPQEEIKVEPKKQQPIQPEPQPEEKVEEVPSPAPEEKVKLIRFAAQPSEIDDTDDTDLHEDTDEYSEDPELIMTMAPTITIEDDDLHSPTFTSSTTGSSTNVTPRVDLNQIPIDLKSLMIQQALHQVEAHRLQLEHHQKEMQYWQEYHQKLLNLQ
jgi:hypothetical protein